MTVNIYVQMDPVQCDRNICETRPGHDTDTAVFMFSGYVHAVTSSGTARRALHAIHARRALHEMASYTGASNRLRMKMSSLGFSVTRRHCTQKSNLGRRIFQWYIIVNTWLVRTVRAFLTHLPATLCTLRRVQFAVKSKGGPAVRFHRKSTSRTASGSSFTLWRSMKPNQPQRLVAGIREAAMYSATEARRSRFVGLQTRQSVKYIDARPLGGFCLHDSAVIPLLTAQPRRLRSILLCHYHTRGGRARNRWEIDSLVPLSEEDEDFNGLRCGRCR